MARIAFTRPGRRSAPSSAVRPEGSAGSGTFALRIAAVTSFALVASLGSAGSMAPAALGATPSETASVAAARAFDSCPAAYDVAELVRGQAVEGLTVTQGSEPTPFTGEVIGVLNNGIGAGLDMIMMRLTSPELERVGGIWQGMSGSPVYASDGRLIGAVSYGLTTGPSLVAGVTPAADMFGYLPPERLDLLGRHDSSSAQRRVTVRLSAAEAATLAARTQLSLAQAQAGFARLRTPMTLSGLTGKQVRLAKKLLKLQGTKVYSGGTGAKRHARGPATDIVAGGNLGASIGYGDFSAVSIGTVTAVCGQGVLGFGHPMEWLGATSAGLHGADALYIQEDPTLAGFKLANPTDPVGTITQDRLTTVAGVLGTLPESVPITSVMSREGGEPRTAKTYAPVPEFLAQVAALAQLVNVNSVFDQSTDGSADLSYSITGNASGNEFAYTRSDRVVSSFDFGYEVGDTLYSDLTSILDNKFTEVEIEDVTFAADLSPDARTYRIDTVERKARGQWEVVSSSQPLVSQPGKLIRLRVTTKSFRDALPVQVRTLRLVAPEVSQRSPMATLVVRGAPRFNFFDSFLAPQGPDKAESFEDMLASMGSQARGDQIVAEFLKPSGRPLTGAEGARDVGRKLDHVVRGQKTFDVFLGSL